MGNDQFETHVIIKTMTFDGDVDIQCDWKRMRTS
jgi:hypothetical protein